MNTQNNNAVMLQQITDLLKKTTEMSYYLDLLKILSSEYLIAVAVKDTPGSKMTSPIIQKIRSLGFSKFDSKLWLMYAGVIYRSEALFNRSGEKPELSVFYEGDINGCHVSIGSEAYRSGNCASIIIDGNEYAMNNRGVNIVVYDTENHVLIDSISFDSHEKPAGTFTRKDQKAVICSSTDIESIIIQINTKLDALTKTVALNAYKTNYVYWNQARAEGETTLDAKKRFFKSLQTDDYEASVLQKSTTILLIEFEKICAQNNIDYWLDFGTLLGAVRHNGFVPWDDDIDVGMMRKDLPKLKKAVSEADTCIEISNYYMIENSICNICRVIFKEPSLKQFVDIFIYDNCDSNSEEVWKKYRKNRTDYIAQLLKFRPVPLTDPILDFWEKRRVINQEHLDTIYSVTNKFLESDTTENGDYIIWGIDNYSFFTGKKGLYKVSDIFPLQKMEFYGKLYNVPNKYEEYLKGLYGDIYSLPDNMLTHKHVRMVPGMMEKSIEMIEQYYK